MSKSIARVDYLGSAGLVQSTSVGAWDFLYRANTVKDPKWNIGDRVVLPDGRVFRYGKCGASAEFGVTSMKRGVQNHAMLVTELATICAAAAVGDGSVTLTFNGDFWDVALTSDSLCGGYISIYNSSTVRDQRGIVGNTAVDATGGECTIYLDAPISTAFISAVNCEVLSNPYSDLQQGVGGAWAAVMGMPCSLAAAGEYFWIQTWGPIRISPAGTELGVNASERTFVFAGNASLRSFDANDALDFSEQIAGFIIERTGNGGGGVAGSAAPFIMLQISP